MEIINYNTYEIDSQGYFTGNIQISNKYIGVLPNYVSIPMGEIPYGKFAKYENGSWLFVDEKIYPIEVPNTITPLQAKLQLLELGLLDEVDTLVATDRKVQLYWEYALTIERNNEVLLLMANTLGLTSEQLDDMFIQASKL